MLMRAFANFVSKALNPTFVSLAAIFLVVWNQELPISQKFLWFLLSVLVAIIPTVVLYITVHKEEGVSFWAPEGKKRISAFFSWVLVALIYSVLAYFFDSPKIVLGFAFVLLFIGIINLVTASFFKISVHCEAITLLVIICILVGSVNQIYLTILIFLVGWSRLYLKAHEFTEVTFGIFAAIFTIFAVFSFLGLATF